MNIKNLFNKEILNKIPSISSVKDKIYAVNKKGSAEQPSFKENTEKNSFIKEIVSKTGKRNEKSEGEPEDVEFATTEQIEQELERETYKFKFKMTLASTIRILVVVCAVSVLIATLLCPVMKIYGSSMTPTLDQGQFVISVKGADPETGDIVGVYYGSKVLIKRCIATSGQWVNIDNDGNVFVDNKLLEEPYISKKDRGECDIEMPYQVPDNTVFVMGDHRETSIDSRNTSVGCIAEEDIVGKIVLCIWPFEKFGKVK